MTAIAEAKKALRRIESELSDRITAFQEETGLTITDLGLEQTDARTVQDHAAGFNRYLARVKLRAEVEG